MTGMKKNSKERDFYNYIRELLIKHRKKNNIDLYQFAEKQLKIEMNDNPSPKQISNRYQLLYLRERGTSFHSVYSLYITLISLNISINDFFTEFKQLLDERPEDERLIYDSGRDNME